MSNLDVQVWVEQGSRVHVRRPTDDAETVCVTIDGVDLFMPMVTLRMLAITLDTYKFGDDVECTL